MPDLKKKEIDDRNKKEAEFIKEKIGKRPGSLRYKVKRILAKFLIAVLLGAAGGGSFLTVVFIGGSHMTESPETEPIVLPTDVDPGEAEKESNEAQTESQPGPEETLPEASESTMDEEESLDAAKEESLEAERKQKEMLKEAAASAVDEYFQTYVPDSSDLNALNNTITEVLTGLKNGFVTVTSVRTNKDWFDNELKEKGTTGGIITEITDTEILILTDSGTLEDGEEIQISFYEGSQFPGQIKATDSTLGISVISVIKQAVPSELMDTLQVVELGNSYGLQNGNFILAVGAPYGIVGSVASGRVVYIDRNAQGMDSSYRIIYTDMELSQDARGFVVNLEGEVMGFLTESSQEDVPCAVIAVSEIKPYIENLYNGNSAASIGIMGRNVTAEISQTQELPEGIYITDIMEDSTAFEAGVQYGDILVGIGEEDIKSLTELQNFLTTSQPGTEVTLRVMRFGAMEYKEMSLTAILGRR